MSSAPPSSSAPKTAASTAAKQAPKRFGWVLQRISGLPLSTGVKFVNPFGLFIITSAVGGLGVLINEVLVHKLSTWNIEGDHKKLYYETIPKTKPDFILAWEAKYGNKEE